MPWRDTPSQVARSAVLGMVALTATQRTLPMGLSCISRSLLISLMRPTTPASREAPRSSESRCTCDSGQGQGQAELTNSQAQGSDISMRSQRPWGWLSTGHGETAGAAGGGAAAAQAPAVPLPSAHFRLALAPPRR